jgi:transposase
VAVLGADEQSAEWSFANDEGGIAELVGRLKGLELGRVVMEASGGYETAAASVLAAAGVPVVVVNPRQARHFAKATGQWAKNDRIDARVLAEFGRRVHPPVRPLPDGEQRDLTELLDRRVQLVQMRAQEKVRLANTAPVARPSVKEHIEWLDARIARLDIDLTVRLRTSAVWKVKVDLLKRVPGVGRVTIFTLLARLPELGQLSRGKVAALVGLAPFADDSGKRRGERHVQGGRAVVRQAMYMAALSARTHNPVIRAMFERLTAAGKPYKVAMTACMRKLLIILNAMVRTGRPWKASEITG